MALPSRSPASDNQTQSFNTEVRTNDATQTVVGQFNTYPGGAYLVKGFIHAKNPSTIDVGGWDVSALFKNINGTASFVGSLDIIENKDVNISATLSASGSRVRCLVTGIAATNFIWRADLTLRRLDLNQ